MLSYFIKNSIYYAAESICRFDPSTIEWTVDLVLRRGDWKDLMLLRSVLSISNDKIVLKHLLNQSINFKNISVFNEFLSLWTDPVGALSENPNIPHVLKRMASDGLTLPSLLDREEIGQDHFLLADTLKECEKAGNHQLASELITKFPSQSFSLLYDPLLIDLLRQIIVTSQWNDDINLPVNTQKTLAMLLASFHFPQPGILEIFGRLVRSGGRVDNTILEELSWKKTLLYYNSVNSGPSCIIS